MFIDKKKNVLINFKVTEEQKIMIDQMAKDRNMTVTKLIMCLLEQELKNPQIKANPFWPLNLPPLGGVRLLDILNTAKVIFIEAVSNKRLDFCP